MSCLAARRETGQPPTIGLLRAHTSFTLQPMPGSQVAPSTSHASPSLPAHLATPESVAPPSSSTWHTGSPHVRNQRNVVPPCPPPPCPPMPPVPAPPSGIGGGVAVVHAASPESATTATRRVIMLPG